MDVFIPPPAEGIPKIDAEDPPLADDVAPKGDALRVLLVAPNGELLGAEPVLAPKGEEAGADDCPVDPNGDAADVEPLPKEKGLLFSVDPLGVVVVVVAEPKGEALGCELEEVLPNGEEDGVDEAAGGAPKLKPGPLLDASLG